MLDPARLRNRLKMRQLTLLAAMSDLGTLHKAAGRLGVSQPAATRLIRELESTMDAPLFERSGRGLEPTDLGRLLMRHASLVVAGIDHVYGDAMALKSGDAGNLKIGVAPGVCPNLLPRAILRLKHTSPSLEIQIIEGPHDLLISNLREGGLNMVLGRAPALTDTPTLRFEELMREHFCIVRGAQNELAPLRGARGLADLLDCAWVLPPASTPLRNSLDLQFVSQCGRLPRERVESTSVIATLQLLNLGNYIALMTGTMAEHFQSTGQVRVLLAAIPDLVGPIGILTAEDSDHQSPTAGRLVHTLRAEVAQIHTNKLSPGSTF